MAEGQIKWYSEKKGYGFITTNEGDELFFHRSGIQDYGYFGLQKSIRVTYEIKSTPRGNQAVKVKPV
jgi:CspA family cold shock protein